MVIVARVDDRENTLGHIAANTGNTKLFKVYFSLKATTTILHKVIAGDFSTDISKTAWISI